jgi:hypothetical protein
MGGSAIVSDSSNRIFFNIGNRLNEGHNGDFPSGGRVHLDTLSEVILNWRSIC